MRTVLLFMFLALSSVSMAQNNEQRMMFEDTSRIGAPYAKDGITFERDKTNPICSRTRADGPTFSIRVTPTMVKPGASHKKRCIGQTTPLICDSCR